MIELYNKGEITKAEVYMRQFEGALAINISKPTLEKISNKLGYIEKDKTDLMMFWNYDTESITEGKIYCFLGSLDMSIENYIISHPVIETTDNFTTEYSLEEIAFQLDELNKGKYKDITELPFFKTLYKNQGKLPQNKWEVLGKNIF